ncbi:PREDICTED: pentatricopeptide repeat-containing protein At1g01970-like [Nelumbo nucifera]|uniref:Pentatricopeptide repeat-containing protein At1g01970-like n=2 Tax=Nelumbo nucifera TaxID=4432 RepID=A0A1U8AR46_NELNU|nr:PREDICTED: pentatricopeptide repeat-containing protein At1g01970-like [Nelumbo nucifera]
MNICVLNSGNKFIMSVSFGTHVYSSTLRFSQKCFILTHELVSFFLHACNVLSTINHLNLPLLLPEPKFYCTINASQVMELALVQESFEANVRDYTKIIDGYGKKNRLHDAESVFQTMKNRGFTYDQVILTAMIQMYSKAGCLRQAEATFEEIKLLGLPLDKRAYGPMIMGYVRAGMLSHGECLLREMEAQEIYAGREVYKALSRAYSTIGDRKGAQRVFDAIKFAGIAPDIKLCALLINAYAVAGQSDGARSVFENLRNAGIEPSDKCVALMLAAYEKENKFKKALDLLIDLEKEGIMVGKEASEILVGWFRRLGVVGEVELVLREYSAEEVKCEIHFIPSEVHLWKTLPWEIGQNF